MKRIKTEVLVLGNGAAALFAANRLYSLGIDAVFVNPFESYSIEDLRPLSGLGLWDAAYRSDPAKADQVHFPHLFESLEEKLRECFPAPIEVAGLRKTSHWSILSSTPVHRAFSERFEKEFFKHDKKPWSTGQIRLVNREHFGLSSKKWGMQFQKVSQIEAGVQRGFGMTWDPVRMGYFLQHFVKNKREQDSESHWFSGVNIKGRYGKKLVIESQKHGEVSIECERAMLIFLTGELLPKIKNIVSSCNEAWIQGVRKKRRENHWLHFESRNLFSEDSPVWVELGELNYFISSQGSTVSWQSKKGPDGFEKAVDEALRVQLARDARFVHWDRTFMLEWEWRVPQWRNTSHDAYWATAFEGNLWNIMELVWNLPIL